MRLNSIHESKLLCSIITKWILDAGFKCSDCAQYLWSHDNESMAVSQKSRRCLPPYYIQLGATELCGIVSDLSSYSLFTPTTFFSLCESTCIRAANTEWVYFRAMLLSQWEDTSLGLNNVYVGYSGKFLLISWFIVLWVQVSGHTYHELMMYSIFSFELWVFEFNFFTKIVLIDTDYGFSFLSHCIIMRTIVFGHS